MDERGTDIWIEIREGVNGRGGNTVKETGCNVEEEDIDGGKTISARIGAGCGKICGVRRVDLTQGRERMRTRATGTIGGRTSFAYITYLLRKYGLTINFTFVPPSQRPVQGKHPEVAAEHLAPSTTKRRQPHTCAFFLRSHATLLTLSSHLVFLLQRRGNENRKQQGRGRKESNRQKRTVEAPACGATAGAASLLSVRCASPLPLSIPGPGFTSCRAVEIDDFNSDKRFLAQAAACAMQDRVRSRKSNQSLELRRCAMVVDRDEVRLSIFLTLNVVLLQPQRGCLPHKRGPPPTA
ncbi:hypothetical protein C8R44DRAFT_743028 [Mycena epipterygia]|nr:hypothetical protein C8R44DRAFT_743028 [Mycena epipterygia]